MNIPIIIPAYEPDEKLVKLVEELNRAELKPIVVVNDGSDKDKFGGIFSKVRENGAVVLEHAVNMGKGRALKTAFNYCLNRYEDLKGVITADSDGQHTLEDIRKCIDVLLRNPDTLVLGVRNFDESGIPARSVFGNKVTRRIMKLLSESPHFIYTNLFFREMIQ